MHDDLETGSVGDRHTGSGSLANSLKIAGPVIRDDAGAVILGAATISTSSWPTRTALVMNSVWAVPHFLIHVARAGHLAPRTAAILLALLGLAVLLPAGLLVLALRTASPSRT